MDLKEAKYSTFLEEDEFKEKCGEPDANWPTSSYTGLSQLHRSPFTRNSLSA